MSKTFRIIGIIVAVFIALAVITGLLWSSLISSGIYTDEYQEDKYITEENEVNSLRLSCSSEDVRFGKSSDGKLHINYTETPKNKYEYRYNNGTAEFKKKSMINIWFSKIQFESYEIEVLIPDSLTDTLNIEMTSGSIKLNQDSAFNDLKIHISSGQADISNVSINNRLDYSASSGDLYAENITSVYGDFTASSGQIEMVGLNFTETLEARVTSGEIRTNKVYADKASLSSSSGTIRITDCVFETLLDMNSNSGNVYGEKIYSAKIVRNASSGNTEISIDDSADNYSLDISTSSGRTNVSDKEKTYFKGDGDISFGAGDKKISLNSSSGNNKIIFEQ